MKIIFIDLTEEQRAMRQGNRKCRPEYPLTDKLLILEDKKHKKGFFQCPIEFIGIGKSHVKEIFFFF